MNKTKLIGIFAIVAISIILFGSFSNKTEASTFSETYIQNKEEESFDNRMKLAQRNNKMVMRTLTPDATMNDVAAQGLFLRFIGASKNVAEKGTMRAYLRNHVGITDVSEQNTILSIAEDYVTLANTYYADARTKVLEYHPTHGAFSAPDLAYLQGLQTNKNSLVETAFFDLSEGISANSFGNVGQLINQRVKNMARWNATEQAWVFADTWISVRSDAPNAYENPQTSGNNLIMYGVGELATRVVYERLLTSSYHGIQLHAKLRKVRAAPDSPIDIVSGFEQTTTIDANSKFAVTLSYQINNDTPSNDGPYDSIIQHIPMCPESHPPVTYEPFPNTPTPTGGWVGISYLRFDYMYNNGFTYKYRHMHWQNKFQCPSTCGKSLYTEEWTLAVMDWKFRPGDRIGMFVPFGPYGCLMMSFGYPNANTAVCKDSISVG